MQASHFSVGKIKIIDKVVCCPLLAAGYALNAKNPYSVCTGIEFLALEALYGQQRI